MQRREPCATCSSVSVGGNKRRILPTALHSLNPQLPGPPAQWVFWIFFFYENNGLQKELQKSRLAEMGLESLFF